MRAFRVVTTYDSGHDPAEAIDEFATEDEAVAHLNARSDEDGVTKAELFRRGDDMNPTQHPPSDPKATGIPPGRPAPGAAAQQDINLNTGQRVRDEAEKLGDEAKAVFARGLDAFRTKVETVGREWSAAHPAPAAQQQGNQSNPQTAA